MACQYPECLIDRGLDKAWKVARKVALLKVRKKVTENRPIFAVKFGPRIPSLQQITAKHWRSMTLQDQYLNKCFPKPPLVAYRRQAHIFLKN